MSVCCCARSPMPATGVLASRWGSRGRPPTRGARGAVRRIGHWRDVTFLGRVGRDDVVRALADCDALVVPSVSPEAFGLVVVEAMGVGRAVLGCRVGAIPDLVADGVSGLVVEPPIRHALADGLVRLASQPDLCRDMGEARPARAWRTPPTTS